MPTNNIIKLIIAVIAFVGGMAIAMTTTSIPVAIVAWVTGICGFSAIGYILVEPCPPYPFHE